MTHPPILTGSFRLLRIAAALAVLAASMATHAQAASHKLYFRLHGLHVVDSNPPIEVPGDRGGTPTGPTDPTGPKEPEGPTDPTEQPTPDNAKLGYMAVFDFGDVPIGVTTTKVVPYSAEGTKGFLRFPVPGAVTAGLGFALSKDEYLCGPDLPVGQMCSVKLSVTPTTLGPLAGAYRMTVEESGAVAKNFSTQLKANVVNPLLFKLPEKLVLQKGAAMAQFNMKEYMTYEGEPQSTFKGAQFTMAEALPSGLLFDVANGTITGTPLAKTTEPHATIKPKVLYKGASGSSEMSIEVLAELQRAQHIAMGLTHACLLTPEGAVKCWGDNSYGQRGATSISTPATELNVVPGMESSVSSISAGIGFTCALKTTGSVTCWGWNSVGQLGNNASASTRYTPINSGAKFLVSGSQHSCIIKTTGKAMCWGAGSNGRLGDGSNSTNAFADVKMNYTGLNFVQLSAGNSHTCGVVQTGQAFCWGDDSNYKTGTSMNGGAGGVAIAQPVINLSTDVSHISAGHSSTCAVKSSGELYCWGAADLNGEALASKYPVQPVMDRNGQRISYASNVFTTVHSPNGVNCFTDRAGALQCWGVVKAGELGNLNQDITVRIPAATPLAAGASGVAKGLDVMCALVGTQTQCWGKNSTGLLGNGTKPPLQFP